LSTITKYIRKNTTNCTKQVHVRFQLYDKGKKYYYTSDILVHPTLWDFTTNLYGLKNHFTDTSVKDINFQIIELSEIISNIYDTRNPYDEISSDWLTEKVDNEIKYRKVKDNLTLTPLVYEVEKYIKHHRMSESRRRTFNIILSTFTSFEKYYSIRKGRQVIFTYMDINHEVIDSYLDFLKNEHFLFKEYNEIYSTRGIEKVNKRSRNCCNEYLKKFRCIIKDIEKKTHSSYYPFQNYRIPSSKLDKPVVTKDFELKQIYDFETNDKTLELVKDNFLLHTQINSRIEDFRNLRYTDILLQTNPNNGQMINYLEFYPQKTVNSSGVMVSIPLNNLAREIINKYRGKSEYLIPHYCDQYYNRKLKELFKLVGLDRIITRSNTKSNMTEQVEFFNLASSHLSRRTSISLLYKYGCPEEMVSDISGHKSNSVKSRYLEFELSEKLDYLNRISPWSNEQVLFDIKNNRIIEPEDKQSNKHIPFIPSRMVV
jgi:integrase